MHSLLTDDDACPFVFDKRRGCFDTFLALFQPVTQAVVEKATRQVVTACARRGETWRGVAWRRLTVLRIS